MTVSEKLFENGLEGRGPVLIYSAIPAFAYRWML
jgi:hypothetical protein